MLLSAAVLSVPSPGAPTSLELLSRLQSFTHTVSKSNVIVYSTFLATLIYHRSSTLRLISMKSFILIFSI
jgi:hypothetical protein